MKANKLIEKLWQIIDDIDTIGDIAKDNDKAFRSMVEKKQKERWKLPIDTNGYDLDLSKIDFNDIKIKKFDEDKKHPIFGEMSVALDYYDKKTQPN